MYLLFNGFIYLSSLINVILFFFVAVKVFSIIFKVFSATETDSNPFSFRTGIVRFSFIISSFSTIFLAVPFLLNIVLAFDKYRIRCAAGNLELEQACLTNLRNNIWFLIGEKLTVHTSNIYSNVSILFYLILISYTLLVFLLLVGFLRLTVRLSDRMRHRFKKRSLP